MEPKVRFSNLQKQIGGRLEDSPSLFLSWHLRGSSSYSRIHAGIQRNQAETNQRARFAFSEVSPSSCLRRNRRRRKRSAIRLRFRGPEQFREARAEELRYPCRKFHGIQVMSNPNATVTKKTKVSPLSPFPHRRTHWLETGRAVCRIKSQ